MALYGYSYWVKGCKPFTHSSLPQCESHCGFSILSTSTCSITSHYPLQRSHLVLLLSPSCRPQLKSPMTDTPVTDKPVEKWLRADRWLNVEHLLRFLLCVARPSYFFNCWPCGNCRLLPRAFLVQVTAECISSTESCLSMDATLSAADTPRTTPRYRDLRSASAS